MSIPGMTGCELRQGHARPHPKKKKPQRELGLERQEVDPMSRNKAITGNAARKARKKAGIKLIKEPKTPTPLLERSWFTATFPGVAGTRNAGKPMSRSAKKVKRALEARGVAPDEVAS